MSGHAVQTCLPTRTRWQGPAAGAVMSRDKGNAHLFSLNRARGQPAGGARAARPAGLRLRGPRRRVAGCARPRGRRAYTRGSSGPDASGTLRGPANPGEGQPGNRSARNWSRTVIELVRLCSQRRALSSAARSSRTRPSKPPTHSLHRTARAVVPVSGCYVLRLEKIRILQIGIQNAIWSESGLLTQQSFRVFLSYLIRPLHRPRLL